MDEACNKDGIEQNIETYQTVRLGEVKEEDSKDGWENEIEEDLKILNLEKRTADKKKS